ncbi:MAG: hypothetical protein A2X13_06120 [Bacteroidetes bacterium GWC2_33_15]|nr:MAG: hypothetical protein A2X10_03640 [Bacteroidetes bacterium GWA2_33_15]OFX51799.1 MAG: hypothetical protein A2X13_06120 [Bacteroidetes bacterium GWC2_33_15]OFX66829.1 MAG: hypothetical protein A2X15_09005 [Bacteroidetes bacterium GWB2_32_14]OFX67087.1 MAG: hypothetical protein A2X14_10510 [Bacteroidetes bacterium GWD2_33_33]HAN17177.1 hypothetical protein [Bacteroidales bacterium]
MFEKFLHQAPFVRFVLPLIAGILIKINFPGLQFPFFEICIFFFVIIAVIEFTNSAYNFVINRVFGVLVSLFILFAGMALVQYKYDKKAEIAEGKYTFIATIAEAPEIKQNSIKAIIELEGIKDSISIKPMHTRLICYFGTDSAFETPVMGDRFIARCFINETKYSGNPNSFNFKRYLFYKDIHYQVYVKPDQYSVIARNKGAKIFLISNQVRQKLLNLYKKYNFDGDEFAVLSALTIGYTSELSPEIKESFSATGAMHVLAVSGLHVGVIFYIIGRLLFFLERNRYGRIIRYILVILVLFGYAFITGLSNSVLRATIMFSFVCVGNIFSGRSNIYNTLSAAAFVMLIYNPFYIMDVGFQLSYIAVLSIVFFQPRIYPLLQFKSYLPDQLWQLISVTLAAQIGTFPLTLFYFHRFPAYFILSNIFVIPLSMFVIYFAVALLAFSFSEPLSKIIAYMLKLLVKAMNLSVQWVESIPYSTINSLNIDRAEFILLLSLLLMISFFIISKRLNYFRYSLVLLIFFLSYNTLKSYTRNNESGLIVYNIPKTSAIEFYAGQEDKLYVNKQKEELAGLVPFNVQPFWDFQKIKSPEIIYNQQELTNEKLITTYSFNKLRIVHLNKNDLVNYETQGILETDYIILSNNVNISIEEIQTYFRFNLLIFDSSNPAYKIQQWKEECDAFGFHYFSVPDKGAFILKTTILAENLNGNIKNINNRFK